MSDTSIDEVVVPRRSDGTELRTLQAENGLVRDAVRVDVVEQARSAISARLDVTPDVAFEMLRGLARSQGRDLDEYAAAVVANRGALDG